jgi:hypothetical protein
MDAGDIAQDVGGDAQALERGLQSGIDFIRSQPPWSVNMGETGDGDVLEQHGGETGERKRDRITACALHGR